MKLSRHLLAAFTAFAAFGVVQGVAPRTASAQEVRVVLAPPAPRYELPGPRPGPYHVWQSGVWAWHPEGHYMWHPGRWVVPPQGRTVWTRDEWVNYGGSWHLVPGHWRGVGEPPPPPAIQRVVVVAAPPPEQVETITVAPVGEAWVGGHWSWDGLRYSWTPGHFMQVPEGQHAWQPGHWYAERGHYFFQSGFWR